jgi:Tol biopolymer transport system component
MKTHDWHFVRHIASQVIVLIAALYLAPAAIGQPRYSNLTWVDRSGEVIETLGVPAEYRGIDVSRDGRRVAAHSHSGAGGDVWVFAPDGEGTRLVAEATGVQDNAHPIFSPDGTKVVYSSLRDGVSGLYIKAVDGSGGEERVHSSGRTVVPMSWSPDGRFIVFWENTGFEWVLPLVGDRTPVRLIAGDNGQSSHSQISPDGKWVVHNAGGNIWVRRFPLERTATSATVTYGSGVQVSSENGVFPRWRGDGREIYYTSAASFGMIMAAVVTATPDSIEVAKPQPLFDTEYINFGHPSNYHTFAVSPDGQRFLIPRPEPDTLVVLDREGRSRTLDTDNWGDPHISPDGSQVAAIRGNRSVWVMDIASGDRRQIGKLNGPQDFAVSLYWSRDGEQVAYIALDLAIGKDVLYLANANGGAEAKQLRTFEGVAGQLLGFTPDGDSLIYFSSQAAGDTLLRIPLAGDAAPVQLARGSTGMQGPRLSPDGRHLAYHTTANNKNEIWVRPLGETGELGEPVRVGDGLGMTTWRADGSELNYVGPKREFMAASVRTSPALAIGAPRRLFDLPSAIPVAAGFDGRGDVSSDGGAVVLAVPPRIPPLPQTEMRVVDRTGKVVATPGEAGNFFGRPMLSPDGKKVAAGITKPLDNVFELWVFDLEADTGKLLFADRNVNSWIWSEDGTELIYVSQDFTTGEGGGIFRRKADGSGTPELLYRYYAGTGFNLIDWSADARFVLFMSGGVLNVLALDRQPREPVELIREEFTVVQALLSPDNRFIAFTSDETRPLNAWVWTFDADKIAVGPASEKLQLTTDGAGGPLSWGWGRNGHEVTYRNAGTVSAVAIATSGTVSAAPPRVLFRHPEAAGNASASRNGERWAFIAPAIDRR